MTLSHSDIAKLYETESDRLQAFVRRLVANPAAAEDLVQQVFAAMLEGRGGAPRNAAAYLTQMARNLAYNHLRDARRRALIETAPEDLERFADPRAGPEATAIHRAELRRLLRAIAALPLRRRQAFVLCRIDGLTYAEIGDRMGVSRNTVISHVVAAMAELDRALK